MDKVNKHPYSNGKIFFSTKHKKAGAIAPLLSDLEIECVEVPVNTDSLGTFTGEISRKGSIRETLRAKIDLAREEAPEAQLILANEGSFGPHPFLPFARSDHEALLLYDVKRDYEIYAEHITFETNHDEIELGPSDQFDNFLKLAKFPEHGLIVHPVGNLSLIFKGIQNEFRLHQAMLDSFAASENGKIRLLTDMRACFNPSRMKAIENAGKNLVQKMMSFCPKCEFPGFSIFRGVPGLTCRDCEQPSAIAKSVIWSCAKCKFELEKNRPDGMKYLDPAECENCNP